jgi:hypothetical protein
MSKAEESMIEDMIARYAGRQIRTIVILAFIFGGWMAKQQLDLEHIKTQQREEMKSHDAVVSDWAAWRKSIDEGTARSVANRFTSDDYDIAASIYNMRTPPAMMPYTGEIKQVKKHQ